VLVKKQKHWRVLSDGQVLRKPLPSAGIRAVEAEPKFQTPAINNYRGSDSTALIAEMVCAGLFFVWGIVLETKTTFRWKFYHILLVYIVVGHCAAQVSFVQRLKGRTMKSKNKQNPFFLARNCCLPQRVLNCNRQISEIVGEYGIVCIPRAQGAAEEQAGEKMRAALDRLQGIFRRVRGTVIIVNDPKRDAIAHVSATKLRLGASLFCFEFAVMEARACPLFDLPHAHIY